MRLLMMTPDLLPHLSDKNELHTMDQLNDRLQNKNLLGHLTSCLHFLDHGISSLFGNQKFQKWSGLQVCLDLCNGRNHHQLNQALGLMFFISFLKNTLRNKLMHCCYSAQASPAPEGASLADVPHLPASAAASAGGIKIEKRALATMIGGRPWRSS